MSVNKETGLVEIHGPTSPEELKRWKMGHDVRRDPLAIARWFMATMQLPTGKDIRHYIR